MVVVNSGVGYYQEQVIISTKKTNGHLLLDVVLRLTETDSSCYHLKKDILCKNIRKQYQDAYQNDWCISRKRLEYL